MHSQPPDAQLGTSGKHSLVKGVRARNYEDTASSSYRDTAGSKQGNYDFWISDTQRHYGYAIAMGHAQRREVLDRPTSFSAREVFGRRR